MATRLLTGIAGVCAGALISDPFVSAKPSLTKISIVCGIAIVCLTLAVVFNSRDE